MTRLCFVISYVGTRGLREDLHSYSDYNVSSIPKADITSVTTRGWWVPWHDEKIDVCQYVEEYNDIPGAKL
jgi:hypothetical protein